MLSSKQLIKQHKSEIQPIGRKSKVLKPQDKSPQVKIPQNQEQSGYESPTHEAKSQLPSQLDKLTKSNTGSSWFDAQTHLQKNRNTAASKNASQNLNSNMLNSANINVDPTQAYGMHDEAGISISEKKKNNFGMYLNKTANRPKKGVTNTEKAGVMSSRTHQVGMSDQKLPLGDKARSARPQSKDSNRSGKPKSRDTSSQRGIYSNQFTVENHEDLAKLPAKPVSKHSMQRVHFGSDPAGGFLHQERHSMGSPPSYPGVALPAMSTETIINVEQVLQYNQNADRHMQYQQYQDAIRQLRESERILDRFDLNSTHDTEEQQQQIAEMDAATEGESVFRHTLPNKEVMKLKFRTYQKIAACLRDQCKYSNSLVYFQKCKNVLLGIIDEEANQSVQNYHEGDELGRHYKEKLIGENNVQLNFEFPDTLMKIAQVQHVLNNNLEALKSSQQANKAGQKSIIQLKRDIMDLLDSQGGIVRRGNVITQDRGSKSPKRSPRKQKYELEEPVAQQQMAILVDSYFTVIANQICIIRTTGQILDAMGSYEPARREYKMAKAVIHGNFLEISQPYVNEEYAPSKHRKYMNDLNDAYEMHKTFVENVINDMGIQFKSPTSALTGYILKLLKDVNKCIVNSSLKIRYLEIPGLMDADLIGRGGFSGTFNLPANSRSDALLKQNLGMAYISKDVKHLMMSQDDLNLGPYRQQSRMQAATPSHQNVRYGTDSEDTPLRPLKNYGKSHGKARYQSNLRGSHQLSYGDTQRTRSIHSNHNQFRSTDVSFKSEVVSKSHNIWHKKTFKTANHFDQARDSQDSQSASSFKVVLPYESQRGRDLNQISELDETMNNNVTPHHEFNPLADEEIDVGENSLMSDDRIKAGFQTSKTAQGDYQKVKVEKRKGDGKKLTSTFNREHGKTQSTLRSTKLNTTKHGGYDSQYAHAQEQARSFLPSFQVYENSETEEVKRGGPLRDTQQRYSNVDITSNRGPFSETKADAESMNIKFDEIKAMRASGFSNHYQGRQQLEAFPAISKTFKMRRSVSKSKSPGRNAATMRNNTRSSSNPRVKMKTRKFAGSNKNSIDVYQPSILKDRKYSGVAQSPTHSNKRTMVSTNTHQNSKTTTSQTTRSIRPGVDTSMTVRKVSLFNIDERQSRSPGKRGRSTSTKKQRSTSNKAARKPSRSVGDKGVAESPRRNRSKPKVDHAQQICKETNLRKSGYPIAIHKGQVYPVEVHGRKHISRKRGKKKIDSFSAQMQHILDCRISADRIVSDQLRKIEQVKAEIYVAENRHKLQTQALNQEEIDKIKQAIAQLRADISNDLSQKLSQQLSNELSSHLTRQMEQLHDTFMNKSFAQAGPPPKANLVAEPQNQNLQTSTAKLMQTSTLQDTQSIQSQLESQVKNHLLVGLESIKVVQAQIKIQQHNILDDMKKQAEFLQADRGGNSQERDPAKKEAAVFESQESKLKSIQEDIRKIQNIDEIETLLEMYVKDLDQLDAQIKQGSIDKATFLKRQQEMVSQMNEIMDKQDQLAIRIQNNCGDQAAALQKAIMLSKSIQAESQIQQRKAGINSLQYPGTKEDLKNATLKSQPASMGDYDENRQTQLSSVADQRMLLGGNISSLTYVQNTDEKVLMKTQQHINSKTQSLETLNIHIKFKEEQDEGLVGIKGWLEITDHKARLMQKKGRSGEIVKNPSKRVVQFDFKNHWKERRNIDHFKHGFVQQGKEYLSQLEFETAPYASHIECMKVVIQDIAKSTMNGQVRAPSNEYHQNNLSKTQHIGSVSLGSERHINKQNTLNQSIDTNKGGRFANTFEGTDGLGRTRRAISILDEKGVTRNSQSRTTSLTLHRYGDEASPSRERLMFEFRKTFPNKLVLQIKILVNDNNQTIRVVGQYLDKVKNTSLHPSDMQGQLQHIVSVIVWQYMMDPSNQDILKEAIVMDQDFDETHVYLSVDLDMIAQKIGEQKDNLPFMKSCSLTLSLGRQDEYDQNIIENYDDRDFVHFQASKDVDTREPDILQKFLAIVKIKTCISRYLLNKRTKEKVKAQAIQSRYVELVQEQHKLRSTDSRNNDPVLPTKFLEAIRVVGKQGMFIGSILKQYIFSYKVHSNRRDVTSDSDPEATCWSLYVKVRGKNHIVWQYHRFSNELLGEAFPEYFKANASSYHRANSNMSSSSMGSKASIKNSVKIEISSVDKNSSKNSANYSSQRGDGFKKTILARQNSNMTRQSGSQSVSAASSDFNNTDEPLETLATFIKSIGKYTVDMILEEALENKKDFLKDPKDKESDKNEIENKLDNINVNNIELDTPTSSGPNKKAKLLSEQAPELNQEQLERWEQWWIENLRQQIHLEL